MTRRTADTGKHRHHTSNSNEAASASSGPTKQDETFIAFDKSSLKDDLKATARLDVAQLDHLGEYIAQLAMKLRFTSNLPELHSLAVDDVKKSAIKTDDSFNDAADKPNQRVTFYQPDTESVFLTEVNANNDLQNSMKGSKRRLSKNSSKMSFSTLSLQKNSIIKSIDAVPIPKVTSSSPIALPNNIDASVILKNVLKARKEEKNAVAVNKFWTASLETDQRHVNLIQDIFWWWAMDMQTHIQKSKDDKQDETSLQSETNISQSHSSSASSPISDSNMARQRVKVQSLLFSRIAQKYTSVFLSAMSRRDRDDFLFKYPSYLSQSTFTAFYECFPQSTHYFTHAFQTRLSNLLGEWFLGIRPYVSLHETWTLDGLFEAAVRLNMRANDTRGEANKNNSDQNGVGDGEDAKKIEEEKEREKEREKGTLKAGADVLERIERVEMQLNKQVEASNNGKQEKISEMIVHEDVIQEESCRMGPFVQTRRMSFDIYCNSPLIRYYLEMKNKGHYHTRSVKIHRREALQDWERTIPSTITYKEAIVESQKSSKRQAKSFKTGLDELTKERAKIFTDTTVEMKLVDKVSGKILAKPAETREVSDQIMELHMIQKVDASAATNNAMVQNILNETNGMALSTAGNSPGNKKKFAEKGLRLLEKEVMQVKPRTPKPILNIRLESGDE